MLRSFAPIALAAMLALPGLPAFAAPADVALLQSYAGVWTGSATLSGAEDGTVKCKLTLKARGEKLSYQGRCSMAGAGGGSFSGVIQFNAQAGRFEATAQDNKTVVGKKSGGGIVFAMSSDNPQGHVDSTMSLTGNALKVDFTIVDGRTKETTKARIPFTRS